MKIAVASTGAWGTALAAHFAHHNHDVVIMGIDEEVVQEINDKRENSRYLPEVSLPQSLHAVSFTEGMEKEFDVMIIATSVAGLRPTLQDWISKKCPEVPILIACKGFEQKTGLLVHEVAHEVIPQNNKIGILSGPSFAKEVALQMPAAIVLASENKEWIENTVQELNTPILRLYASADPIGASVGGAVKNVMAIATGIVDGLNYGLNARAALITRGLHEMNRLAHVLGAKSETMMGLAGMGDLILTCTGNLSRNRNVGLQLALGKSLDQILKDLGHVAEGVNTVKEVVKKSQQFDVDMPITHVLNRMLDGELTPEEAVEELMTREPKNEAQ